MKLIDYFNSTQGSIEEKGETFYSLNSILNNLYSTNLECLEIQESLLLTLFYFDERIYELYPYDLNIDLIDDDLAATPRSVMNVYEAQTQKEIEDVCYKSRINIRKSSPYLNTELLKSYINYIFSNKNIATEVESVFNSVFNIENLYFVIY